MLNICRHLHGYLMYNLLTDHDTLLHFIPITRILGWKGCPLLCLSSFSGDPFLWLEWGNLGHREKTSMFKFPLFPKYQHILNNRTFRHFGLKSSTKKRFTCCQKWKPKPGTLTKPPPPLPSVCGWQSGGEMTHYKVSQGFRIKLKKFLLKFFWSILLAVIAINVLQFSSH